LSSEELTSIDVCGGDLLGVEQKLDYLTELGINGIYFTPIFPALSNHRYDASSFDHVDPILGGDDAWFSLRRAAEAAEIRLVGDLTTNHCGVGHDWFKTALDDPNSDEHGFFYWTDKFECGYESWWGFKSLPKFNFSSHELRQRLYDGQHSVIRKWVTEPFGMSGWRIDVGNMTGRLGEIDLHDEVMHGVRRAMDEVAPDAWLVAENGDFFAYDLAGAGWHGTMNYQGFMRPLTSWMNRNAKLSGGFQGLPVDAPMITGTQFVSTVRAFSAAMPWRALVASMILLDSHDTPRYRTIVAGDRKRHLASMTMLLTFVGVPSIYMGDEIGLEGSGGHDARRTINWEDRSAWDVEFLEDVKRLTALRRHEGALIHGGLRWIAAEENYVAYLRETAEEAILVMIASNATSVQIDLTPYGYEVAETLFGESTSGSVVSLELGDASQGVWRLQSSL
jgi:alpha-glucosidase